MHDLVKVIRGISASYKMYVLSSFMGVFIKFPNFTLTLIQKIHMCCISLHRCCFGLETRIIIKISTQSCYSINFDWFFFQLSNSQFFELTSDSLQPYRLSHIDALCTNLWNFREKNWWIGGVESAILIFFSIFFLCFIPMKIKQHL